MKIFKLVKLMVNNKEKKEIVPRENNIILLHNENRINVNIRILKDFKDKFNSLIFKDHFNEHFAFKIINVRAFNSLGLKNPTDLVFCDIKHQVIETYTSFVPQKLTEYFENARYVYLMNTDSIMRYNIKIGDILITKKILI